MKRIFWNVGIEIYEDGTVLSTVLRNRLADNQPADVYKREPKREIYSVWFSKEDEAHNAVYEALGWNKKEGVAA
jgi:hypothetical protein